MKEIPRNPVPFEAVHWLADFCKVRGLTIHDPLARNAFAAWMVDQVGALADDERRLKGIVEESIFEHLVVELGNVTLVKKEDLGPITCDEPVQIPDYRVELDGDSLLVEVKSARRSAGLEVKKQEFSRLVRYAERAGLRLRFAVLWTDCGDWWALVPPEAFRRKGKFFLLDFEQSMIENEMSLLGDRMLGVRTPLKMRIVTDPSRPRSIDSHGLASYTIQAVEFYCQNRLIEDERGKNLAFFILLFNSGGAQPVLDLADDNSTIIAVEWLFAPELDQDQQDMIGVGSLSSLYSRFFRFHATDENGRYVRLRIETVHGRMRALAPDDFPFQTSGLALTVLHLVTPRMSTANVA